MSLSAILTRKHRLRTPFPSTKSQKLAAEGPIVFDDINPGQSHGRSDQALLCTSQKSSERQWDGMSEGSISSDY
jgi:hypothetical protein